MFIDIFLFDTISTFHGMNRYFQIAIGYDFCIVSNGYNKNIFNRYDIDIPLVSSLNTKVYPIIEKNWFEENDDYLKILIFIFKFKKVGVAILILSVL